MDFNLKYLRSYIKAHKIMHTPGATQWLYEAWEHKKTLSHERKSPDFIFHRQIGCFASVTHTRVLTCSCAKEKYGNISNPSAGAPWPRRAGNPLVLGNVDSGNRGWKSLKRKTLTSNPISLGKLQHFLNWLLHDTTAKSYSTIYSKVNF